MKPVVSIVTPTYNRAHLLSRVWASLLKQTEQQFQWVVIDDGSTDTTRDVVAGFADSRIQYVWQQNMGVNGARNRGDREVAADYVVYLDSDDELYDENTLTMMLDEIRQTRPEVAWVAFTVVDSMGGTGLYKLDADRLETDYIDHICEHKFWGEFFSIYRRDVIDLASWPPYNGLEALRHWRIVRHRPVLLVNRPARIYHRNLGDNLTGAQSAIKRASVMAQATEELIQEHFPAWRACCPHQIGKYRVYRAMYLLLSAPGFRALPDLCQAMWFGHLRTKLKAVAMFFAVFFPISLRQRLFLTRAKK